MAISTIRDMVSRAYTQSRVIGTGLNMTSTELSIGIDILNGIFDELYVKNLATSKVIKTATINGRVITVGNDDNESDESPDILVTSVPERIEQITFVQGTSRYDSFPINSSTYFNRGSDVNDQYPTRFWYNSYDSATQFATINFMGLPSGYVELMYNLSITDKDANGSIVDIPRTIRPYIQHELAYRIACENGFANESMYIKANSNTAYNVLLRSCAPEATNDLDKSAIFGGNTSRANNNENQRLLDSGGY